MNRLTKKRMGNIKVFHPGQQHSHQLAAALSGAGLLMDYYCGKPVITGENVLDPLWRWTERVRVAPIESSRVHWQARWFLSEQLAKRCGPSDLSVAERLHVHFHGVDDTFARAGLWRGASVLVGFENSCAKSFVAAKKAGGMVCVLEAPNVHRLMADRILGLPQGRYWAEVDRCKDQEVALADHIVVCSELARQSYLEQGVSEHKVTALLLGGDLGDSGPDPKPGPVVSEKRSAHRPLNLVFAGVSSLRKGMDLLLDAVDAVNRDRELVRLQIAGGVDSATWLDRFNETVGVDYLGHLGGSTLAGVIRAADFLILPSRFDSFGMVVVEALRCGTPVVVAETVGAAAVLRDFPHAGRVVQTGELWADVLCQLQQETLDSGRMAQRRSAARDAAREFDWTSYHKRAAALYSSLG